MAGNIPGQVSSGNMVDDHNQTFWGGAGTPAGMQINVGQASQSAGANGLDPSTMGYQQGLAAQYAAQAAGKGPSLAQMQLQQGTQANIKGQAALAAGGRNPTMSSYNAAQNAGAAGTAMAGQAAQARLAEQYQAQQGLAGITGQMAGQYANQAALSQNNNQFNASANNSNQQLQANINMQQNQAYNGMMAGQQQQYNNYQNQHDLNEQQANNELRNGAISTGIGAAGGALSAISDENQKTDIQGGGSALQGFLDRLKSQPQVSVGGSDSGAVGQGLKSGQQMGQSFVQNLQKTMGGGAGQGAPTGASSSMPGANGSPGALNPGSLNGGQMPGATPDMSAGLSQPTLGSSMMGAGGPGAGLSLGGGSLAAPSMAGMGGLGALGAMSDERQKTGVRDGGGSTGSFLDRLKAHEYRYKHPDLPGAGEGQHVSVMAQELEKAGPVGASMVQDTPNGKMVNYGKGFATMLAAQADLHHRVKTLEQSKGAR